MENGSEILSTLNEGSYFYTKNLYLFLDLIWYIPTLTMCLGKVVGLVGFKCFSAQNQTWTIKH